MPDGTDDYIKDMERGMRNAGEREQSYRKRDPKDSRGFGDWAHHDMQILSESAMKARKAKQGSRKSRGK